MHYIDKENEKGHVGYLKVLYLAQYFKSITNLRGKVHCKKWDFFFAHGFVKKITDFQEYLF
jgi:hypothetical protein